MTDKQINKSEQVSEQVSGQVIIDGVDVSGCNFTLERDGKIKCECCHATGFGVICDCESWKTCDYKNYKRKEQECEKLKIYIESNEQQVKEVETLVMDNDRLINELDQLKAENEELRKQIKIIDDETIVVEITEKQFEEYQKLKQALTEIKEIAEYDFKELMNAEDYHNMTEVLKQILQKCEVLNE